ncbi:hypothetical protein LXL04_025413 [Taraxacum kok-saghyz]
MAEHLESKDESTTNPCCSEWKDRLLKVQQKCKKTEDARAALKKAVGLYERQFTLMQDDIQKIKKACEEEKLQINNERKDKEKELENEISALKSELLSLTQKEGSVPEHIDKELILLRGRVADSEKEIKCLQDQLQKEKTVAATDRKKAVEDRKRADMALQSFKTEKSRIEKELSNLKAQLLNLETEKKQLKNDLQKESARADLEKSRADEALKTAKTETEAEVLMAETIQKLPIVDELKSEDLEVITSLQGRVSELETETTRLKNLVDNEKKKAEIEKKKGNKMREMLKAEQNRAECEKKKGDEFGQQIERLKREADEVRSKLVSEGAKCKEANKKVESERKKSLKEKKIYEDQQKTAELSAKNALEEKQRADRIHQQLEEYQKKYAMLQKEMETKDKQKTKDTKNGPEKVQELVSSRTEKDTNGKYPEMKILKKRLKLEKERVKHANQVADLEKRCKKEAEKELHNLKLEFARFSNRVGLCTCYEICNAGKSCLEQNRKVNLKRKCMDPESGKEEVVKPICVQSVPVSEVTSGTATKTVGGSNRKKNIDNYALVSSMSSFSDRQLVVVGSQGKCKHNPNQQLPVSRLSTEVYKDAVVADNNNIKQKNKDGKNKKRKRAHNATESVEDPSTKTVGGENNNLGNGGKNVEVFKRMLDDDDDYMKLLNLDSEIEEERYRVALERPVSPTLPNIEFESRQLDVLEDSRPSEVNSLNSDDDCCQYIVVFPEMRDSGSLSKVVQTTRNLMTQCCVSSVNDHVIKSIVSALSVEESLSPKEKVCAFFSLFLKSSSSITLTKVNHVLDDNFLKTIDILSGQMNKAMSDAETRAIFEKTCNLDELITLIQDFIINEKVLIHTNINPELSDSKASLQQLVIGAVLLSSVCVAFDRIDSICETSYTISHITTPSTLTLLHIFAYVCGEKLLLAQSDYSLITTVVSSLVIYHEKENASACAKCPFLIGAVSMEELVSVLLKRLVSHAQVKSTDGGLSDLGDVLSLLELVASKMKWGRVCENIVSELLKLLERFVVETPLTAVFVLLGQLARLGIEANGFQDADVENIRIKLSSFITGTTTSPVQFAAVNALLGTTPVSFHEICKKSFLSSSMATDCIQKWFNSLSDDQKALSVRLLTATVS